jgi:hypothetical protein
MDANDVAVLENLNKSIYDPTSRKADGNEFGLGDLSPSIPEFNPTEQSQAFAVASSKAKPTYNETKARIDNVTGKVFIPKEFKEDDVKSIAEGYGNLALGNRKIEKHYNNLRKSAEFMAEADLAYKSVYGQNANITTAAEAAKADAIMKARLAGEEVEVTDPNYANELKIRLKKTIPGKAPSAPRAGAATTGAPIVDRYTPVSKLIDDVNNAPVPLTDLDIATSDEIMKTAGATKYDEPGDFVVNKDANGNIVVSRKDGNTLTKVGTWGRVTANIKATPGVKGKQEIAKTGETGKTPPKQKKISDYPSNIQNAIKAYMGASKLNEADAIDKLIKAGKLK